MLPPSSSATPAPALSSQQVLAIAQRLQALAQAGLAYAPPPYDTEHYEEVLALSLQLLAGLTGEPVAQLGALFAGETGYPTPPTLSRTREGLQNERTRYGQRNG